jgi:hypothetical protein
MVKITNNIRHLQACAQNFYLYVYKKFLVIVSA